MQGMRENSVAAGTGERHMFCRSTVLYARDMFKEALKSRNIPVFSIPFGFSLRMKSSDDRNIYVPYEFFNEATDIYDRLFPRTEE